MKSCKVILLNAISCSIMKHIKSTKIKVYCMYLIPNFINIIWMGSFLRETEKFPHQSRILQWTRLNPEHTLHLWVSNSMIDSATYEEFQTFCESNGIVLNNIDTLLMNEKVCDWVKRLMNDPHPNFGALSDIIRLYVLNQMGGWYFDTDVETVGDASLPCNLRTHFGFALNLRYDEESPFYYSPDILVSCPQSSFLLKSIEIIEELVRHETSLDTINHQLHDSLQEKRRLATCYTTGEVAFAACCRLKSWYLAPLISFKMDAPIRTYIPHLDSFKKISVQFLSPELSFICYEESSYLGVCRSLPPEEESEYIDTILTLFNTCIEDVTAQSVITHRFKNIGFWTDQPTISEHQKSIDSVLKFS